MGKKSESEKDEKGHRKKTSGRKPSPEKEEEKIQRDRHKANDPLFIA